MRFEDLSKIRIKKMKYSIYYMYTYKDTNQIKDEICFHLEANSANKKLIFCHTIDMSLRERPFNFQSVVGIWLFFFIWSCFWYHTSIKHYSYVCLEILFRELPLNLLTNYNSHCFSFSLIQTCILLSLKPEHFVWQ